MRENLNFRRLLSTNNTNRTNNKNSQYPDEFCNWFGGFTDGDGSFSIVKSGGSYRLHFGISQSFYNIRILYYIKSVLGYGSVTKYEREKTAQFRITDRKILAKVIFPIFDKYPLLTSKYFNYLKFKEVYGILERVDLTTKEKNILIENIKNKPLANDYVSPGISFLSINSTYETIISTISIYWLAGFIEAEGNFGIYPDRGRFNIEFTLVQKLDKFLLELIRKILHVSSKIKLNTINNSYIHVLNTKNSRTISNIINIFQGKFKGIKSLEFKLWSKANYYKNTDRIKVEKIHRIMAKLRKKAS